MCGIAGIWGHADEPLVRAMMDRLVHRGPDAEGVHQGRQGTMGHRRLAIMDPLGGDQPLYNEDRTQAIVANGEIYNFPALRTSLAGEHRFRTLSDSESTLHLYEDVGDALVQQLDGMFAFAIADGDDLVLVRDPIGIKPLYYGRRQGSLIFASELKALAGVAEDVRTFAPGTLYRSGVGFRRYYDVPGGSTEAVPFEVLLTRLRKALEDAVVKRLMSDVPLGAFLSGGLDSSLIAALARPHVETLHTFSVGVEGSPDLAAARAVARHLDTAHHEHVITPTEIRYTLPEVIYHLESYDRDLVRSAIPCYFVSRLAAEHVKVVLTGEGADELFAGYAYYEAYSQAGDLQDELRRSIGTLHNINLQRVDRLTMAHSIEGRVPFLDVEMIDLALAVPPELKLCGGRDGTLEKWILRKACEDLLPPEILWREKEQFDEGSGTLAVLPELLGHWLGADQAQRYRAEHPEAGLVSREECVYHRLLLEAYERPEAILANVARWSQRLEPEGPARVGTKEA